MHLDAYQEEAIKNAMFDSLPEGFPPTAYCALALGGELGEAILAKQGASQVKEMGDVMWYLVALADTLGFLMSDVDSAPVVTNWSGLAARCGAIQEHVKKLYRDAGGAMDAARRTQLQKDMREFFGAFRGMCRVVGTTVDDVMEANLDKLRDRSARGVLKGEGSDR